jgi:Thrombospondin type 3 repeat
MPGHTCGRLRDWHHRPRATPLLATVITAVAASITAAIVLLCQSQTLEADESQTPTVTATATTNATATSNPDSDLDGVPNEADNCPAWPNENQGLPEWPVPADDPDCDGFSSAVEVQAGTHALVHCGSDAWPADANNDSFSDITDIADLDGNFGESVPPAPARQDIAPDPVDGFIDITDMSKMVAFYGATCIEAPAIPTTTPTPSTTPTPATPTAISTATPTPSPTER